MALGNARHLVKVPACLAARAPFRRSTVAFLLSGPLFWARTDEHHLAPIQAAFAPPFVLPVAAIEGGPSCEGRAVIRDDPVL